MTSDPERFREADETMDLYLLTIDNDGEQPRVLGPYADDETRVGQARLEHDLREHGVHRHLFRLNVGKRVSVETFDHTELLPDPEPETKHLLMPARMRQPGRPATWCGSTGASTVSAGEMSCFECAERYLEFAS